MDEFFIKQTRRILRGQWETLYILARHYELITGHHRYDTTKWEALMEFVEMIENIQRDIRGLNIKTDALEHLLSGNQVAEGEGNAEG